MREVGFNGVKVLNGRIYRIKDCTTGFCQVIECESEEAMVRYVAHLSMTNIISSVSEIEIRYGNVSTPQVAIKSHPLYKQLMKEYLKSMKNSMKNSK